MPRQRRMPEPRTRAAAPIEAGRPPRFARFAYDEQGCENRDQRPFYEECLEQRTGHGGGDFETRLVGFDLRHHFARRDRIAFLLAPLGDQALFNCVAEFRHFYRGSHISNNSRSGLVSTPMAPRRGPSAGSSASAEPYHRSARVFLKTQPR